jgi:mediator of RNA polymerase II transcription subunit 6
VESWSAAQGRTYHQPAAPGTSSSTTTKQPDGTALPDAALPSPSVLEEALAIHTHFGDHYMNENPITGRPGDFHLSSTGRKLVSLSAPAAGNLKKGPALPALNTKVGDGGGSENPLASKPSGKETKSPKTPGGGSAMQKAKKRKGSKAVVTPQ